MPTTYQPGLHNLDASETRQRRQSGWVGLVLTIFVSVALFYFRASPPWRLLLFFPVTMGAIGFLQAGEKFCVMVALSNRSPATTASERKKDRHTAIRLIATAMMIGAIVAIGAYLARR